MAGPSLTVELREGPPLTTTRSRWVVRPGQTLSIGRGSDCELNLPDASVSRRHATVAFEETDWVLRDLGSRHGCAVGGRAIEPGGSSVLGEGEEIQIGAWLFGVRLEDGSSPGVTIEARSTAGERVRRLAPEEIGPLVRRRLDVVLEMGESLGDAADVAAVAEHAVSAIRRGLGIRSGGAQVAWVEIDREGAIGRIVSSSAGEHGFTMSTSLLREAASGGLAVLETDSPGHAYGMSIMALGIRSACCAPVYDGESVAAVLYLDTRDDTEGADGDATSFVSATARISGLALSNLRRGVLERQRVVIEADLRAARAAQRMMMPEPKGTIGGMSFAVVSRPGRHVAGDLIGIEPRADGKIAFYLGDVTGKGAGAAMVMAIAQSYLSATLEHGAAIEDAARGLNAMLAPRIEHGQFVSLWLGEFDPGTHVVRAIDAGHGYAMLRSPDGAVRSGLGGGALPIGIDTDPEFKPETVRTDPGAMLLLFSDGLIEQPGVDGASDRYGTDRARAVLSASVDPEALVVGLESALRAYAGHDEFDDDLTIASFRFG